MPQWKTLFFCVAGKSTLSGSLVAATSVIAQEVAGDVRMNDTWADEAGPFPSFLQYFL